MKKRVQKEPMLNTLARKVGRAAGTIAKAAQELAQAMPPQLCRQMWQSHPRRERSRNKHRSDAPSQKEKRKVRNPSSGNRGWEPELTDHYVKRSREVQPTPYSTSFPEAYAGSVSKVAERART